VSSLNPRKDWLTQTIVPDPLGEFDPTDDYRSDPATTLHFGGSQSLVPAAPATCREIKKGTFLNPNIYPLPLWTPNTKIKAVTSTLK
jgi:hypothetical protein